jgi:hypothetical protein
MLENCVGGEETEEDNDAFMLELFNKKNEFNNNN